MLMCLPWLSSAIILALAVACALASPVEDKSAQILRFGNDAQPDGNYVFGFETDNGIKRDETGTLKDVKDEEGKPQTVLTQQGSYSYPGEDGKPVVISYFADESGFHAEGDSIPRA